MPFIEFMLRGFEATRAGVRALARGNTAPVVYVPAHDALGAPFRLEGTVHGYLHRTRSGASANPAGPPRPFLLPTC